MPCWPRPPWFWSSASCCSAVHWPAPPGRTPTTGRPWHVLGLTARQRTAIQLWRGGLVTGAGTVLAVPGRCVASSRFPIGLARDAEIDPGPRRRHSRPRARRRGLRRPGRGPHPPGGLVRPASGRPARAGHGRRRSALTPTGARRPSGHRGPRSPRGRAAGRPRWSRRSPGWPRSPAAATYAASLDGLIDDPRAPGVDLGRRGRQLLRRRRPGGGSRRAGGQPRRRRLCRLPGRPRRTSTGSP